MPRYLGDSAAAAEYLLAKWCPKLMAAGGGTLPSDRTDDRPPAAKKPIRYVTTFEIAQMVKLYTQPDNLTIHAIAQRLKRSESTVLRHLEQAGVWKRTP